jgi:carbon monoxide dehydrogenase subunit G
LTETIPGLRDLNIEGLAVRGTMVIPLPFIELVSRVEGTVSVDNGQLAVRVTGHPERLVGTFTCDIVLGLGERPETGENGLRYQLTLKTTGRLASLGDAMLRTVSRQQAALFEDRLRTLLNQGARDDD